MRMMRMRRMRKFLHLLTTSKLFFFFLKTHTHKNTSKTQKHIKNTKTHQHEHIKNTSQTKMRMTRFFFF